MEFFIFRKTVSDGEQFHSTKFQNVHSIWTFSKTKESESYPSTLLHDTVIHYF